MKYALAIVLMSASLARGGELILRDSDCKLLGAEGDKVKVLPGDKAEYTCVIIDREASCSYRNVDTGKGQGKPTKYEIIQLQDRQMSSPTNRNPVQSHQSGPTWFERFLV